MRAESEEMEAKGDNREKYGSVVNDAKVLRGPQRQGANTCFRILDYGLH
jgi:hypothetical protein